MRHIAITVILAVLSLAVAAEKGDTQVLALGDTEKALIEDAEAVALVEITHVNSLINHALSLPGMLSVQGYSYQLAPSRQWKGATELSQELRVDLKDCTRLLQKGEQYIVMMTFNGEQWSSQQCDQIVAVANGESVLAYLDHNYSAKLAQQ